MQQAHRHHAKEITLNELTLKLRNIARRLAFTTHGQECWKPQPEWFCKKRNACERIQIGNEKVKLSLFANDMISYVKKTYKDSSEVDRNDEEFNMSCETS